MPKQVLWILALVISGLVACQTNRGEQEGTAPSEIPGPTTAAGFGDGEAVTVKAAIYEWERSRFEDLAEIFEAENPGIRVELVTVEEILDLDPNNLIWPEDADLKLASAADVLEIGVSPATVSRGLVLDLKPFIENDPMLEAADFFPGTLETYQVGGGQYALPLETDLQLFFFDKQTFDRTGLAYPQPGWTWAEFGEAARKLTIREGEQVEEWGFVQANPNPQYLIEARVGSLFDDRSLPAAAKLGEPEVVEAVRWYTDLFRSPEVAPYEAPSSANEERVDLPLGFQFIQEGRAAMWTAFAWSGRILDQSDTAGVAPFPVDEPGSRSTPVYGGRGQSISAGSQNPEAAWKWMVFLTAQGPREDSPGGISALPARQSIAQASGFWEAAGEEMATALRFALEHGYTPRYVEGGPEALNDAISAIVQDGQDVAAALAEAQVQAENNFEEAAARMADLNPTPVIVGPGPEAGPAEETQIALQFITSGGPYELKAVRDLAQEYQEEHRGIAIQVKQPSASGGGITMAEIAADSDCFEWFPDLRSEAARDSILNLDPFVDQDPAIGEDDFFPALVDQFQLDGQLWGLPSEVTVNGIAYNKDLFDEAGEPYPATDWTIADFQDLAIALTTGIDETDKQYGYVPDLFEPSELMTMLDRQGVSLADERDQPPAVDLLNPAVVEAVRWYSDLTLKHGVKPVFVTAITEPVGVEDIERRQALIDDGRAAMWSTSGFSGGYFTSGETEDETAGIRAGLVPLPGGIDGSRNGGYQNTRGYFISAASEERQACWDWITFLTKKPVSDKALPARRTTAASEAYRQLVGRERAEAFLAGLESATGPGFLQRPEYAWMSPAFIWLAQAYDQIIKGGMPVEDALAASQTRVDAYRACLIDSDGFEDPAVQEDCIRQADETLPDSMFGGGEADVILGGD